jgi:hypothetical protein
VAINKITELESVNKFGLRLPIIINYVSYVIINIIIIISFIMEGLMLFYVF